MRGKFIDGLLRLCRDGPDAPLQDERSALVEGIRELSAKGLKELRLWMRHTADIPGWKTAPSLASGTSQFLSGTSVALMEKEVRYWMLWSSSPETSIHDQDHPLRHRPQVAETLREYAEKFYIYMLHAP